MQRSWHNQDQFNKVSAYVTNYKPSHPGWQPLNGHLPSGSSLHCQEAQLLVGVTFVSEDVRLLNLLQPLPGTNFNYISARQHSELATLCYVLTKQ